MSYFLRPHLIGLLAAAKIVSSQKKDQNLTSLISKFTPTCQASTPFPPAMRVMEIPDIITCLPVVGRGIGVTENTFTL